MSENKMKFIPGGDEYEDVLGSRKLMRKVLKAGTKDKRPDFSQEVLVHYKIGLPNLEKEDIDYVIDTRDNGKEPVAIRVGEGDTIPAFDLILPLMDEGEIAMLMVDSSLAYSNRGLKPHIPLNANLVCEIELVKFGREPIDINALYYQPVERLRLVMQKKDRGNELFKQQDYAGAAKSYGLALKILTHKFVNDTTVDQAKLMEGMDPVQSKEINKRLKETHVIICNNMCQVMIKTNQWEQAREAVKAVLAIDPNNTKALFRMGEVQLRGFKDYAEAKHYYSQALALDSKDPAIKLGLAQATEALKKEKQEQKKLFEAMMGGAAKKEKVQTEEKVEESGEKIEEIETEPEVESSGTTSLASSNPATPKTKITKVVKKRAMKTMTHSEERKHGLVNMIAGIILTLLIMYVAYSVSGLIKVNLNTGSEMDDADFDMPHNYEGEDNATYDFKPTTDYDEGDKENVHTHDEV